MDRYAVLRWLRRRVDDLSRRLANYLDPIEKRAAEAKALKPGTKVQIVCSCPDCRQNPWRLGVLWVVERYDYDANDYRLRTDAEAVPSWEDGCTYASRDVLQIVE